MCIFKRNLVTLLTFALLCDLAASQQDIPCNLAWASWMAGEELPETAVATQPGRYYIGRVGSAVGHIDAATSRLYINYLNMTLLTLSSGAVLVNPNDCSISWREAIAGEVSDPGFAVPVGSGAYVGMARTDGNSVAGTVIPGSGSDFGWLYYTFHNEYRSTGMGSFMRSTINLKVTIDRYVFDSVDPADDEPDFLGYDYVENNSEATITHTIVHTKSVTKIYDFTETRSYAHATSIVVDCGISIPGLGSIGVHYNKTETSAFGEEVNMRNETEEAVTSERTIHIPPFTAIQACSTLHSASQKDIPYTARATFEARGKTGRQVQDIVLARGYSANDIIETTGNSVALRVKGAFSMEAPFRTKFIILDPNDPNGCRQLEQRIREKRAQKRNFKV